MTFLLGFLFGYGRNYYGCGGDYPVSYVVNNQTKLSNKIVFHTNK